MGTIIMTLWKAIVVLLEAVGIISLFAILLGLGIGLAVIVWMLIEAWRER